MKRLRFIIRYWGLRILFLSFLAFLIALVFFFKIPEVNFYSFSISNPFYHYTSQLNWTLYLLIYFIGVFISNTLIFGVLTLLIRYNKLRSKLKRVRLAKSFTDILIEIMYAENEKSDDIDEIKLKDLLSMADSNLATTILLDVLRNIHSQVKDDMRAKTSEILDKLHLDEFIKSYLHSPYFSDKIFAMKIISEFEMGMKNVHQFESNEFHDYIINLTRNKNYVLRTEAFISLIKLAMQDDLSFLLDRELHVSVWDMNVVLKIFRDIRTNNINYVKLIESDSPRVAALGLLLANKHNRTELKELISSKIGSKDGLQNYEAYSAFISMAAGDEDYELLTSNFPKENFRIKRSIVKSFEACPSTTLSKTFLKYIIKNESMQLKVEAMKLLVNIDVNVVNEYKDSADLEIISARNQIADLNLN